MFTGRIIRNFFSSYRAQRRSERAQRQGQAPTQPHTKNRKRKAVSPEMEERQQKAAARLQELGVPPLEVRISKGPSDSVCTVEPLIKTTRNKGHASIKGHISLSPKCTYSTPVTYPTNLIYFPMVATIEGFRCNC